MKLSFNRSSAFLLAAALVLSIAGCSKSGGSSSGNSMSASVNGNAWSNSFAMISFYSGSMFDIVGEQFKGGDSTSFSLGFVSPITLNKAISTDTATFIIGYTDIKAGVETGYGAVPGLGKAVLTVTSYDSTGHHIGGTFSGVLYNISTFADSVIITNGKFNTSFIVQ